MLVLSRLPGETIHVGTNITFTVLEVQGRRVRLGISAPSQIPVWRDELGAKAPGQHVGRRDESAETCSCT